MGRLRAQRHGTTRLETLSAVPMQRDRGTVRHDTAGSRVPLRVVPDRARASAESGGPFGHV